MGQPIQPEVHERSRSPPYIPPFSASFHIIADLYGCPASVMNQHVIDVNQTKESIKDIIERHRGTVIDAIMHVFEPIHSGAYTALFMLSESHVSIHTWPEFEFVAVDVFTCGEKADPAQICQSIANYFQADSCDVSFLMRGPSDSRNMTFMPV